VDHYLSVTEEDKARDRQIEIDIGQVAAENFGREGF